MKNISILITFVFTLNVLSYSQKLTLNESIDIGLKNSKNLKIAQSKIDFADARYSEVKSQYYPSFRFNASITKMSDVPNAEIKVPFLPAPIKIQDAIMNSYVTRIAFQQPLFTGFRLSSTKEGLKMLNISAQEDYDSETQNEIYTIIHAYWQFYKASKYDDLVTENLKLVETSLKNAKLLFENDLLTKSDVLKYEVQYANLRVKVLESENLKIKSRINFNRAVGLDLSSHTEIIEEDFSKYDESLNDEYLRYKESALSNRSELKSISLKTNSAFSAIDAVKSSYYPNISLQGSYNYNRPNQRVFPLQDKFYDTWDISLNLSWDIWNWGQTGSQVEQASETYRQSKLLSEKLAENIEVEVFNDFSNKKELSKKISALMTSLQYAEEHLKTIKEKFDIQLATSTELIEAEVMLYQIKTELLNTRADYEIAIAKLKKSAGLKL